MKELVWIHWGDEGIRIGEQYLKTISKEHRIDYTTGQFTNTSNIFDSQKEHAMKSFYENSRNEQLLPRSILIDANFQSFDQVFSEKSMMQNWQKVLGTYNTPGNYAEGKYTTNIVFF